MNEVCEQVLSAIPSTFDSVQLVELVNQGIYFYQNLVAMFAENPIVLGMFLGGVLSAYLRRLLLRSAVRLMQR